MKNLLLSFAVVIICAMTMFISCSRKDMEATHTQTEEKAFNSLMFEIDSINCNYINTYNSETRRVKPWKAIVGADATGFLSGFSVSIMMVPELSFAILIGGVSAIFSSLVSLPATLDETAVTSSNITTNTEMYCCNVGDIELSDSCGMIHNEVIRELYEEYGANNLVAMSKESLLSLINQKVSLKGVDITDYCSLTDFITVTDEISEALQSKDYTLLPDSISTAIFNEKIILDNFVTSLQLVNDSLVVDYSSAVREAINTSSISAKSKTSLNASLSVAISSDELWVEE